MERLRNDNQGLLSMIDAVLFGIIILVVSVLIFQQFGGALTREKDLESSEFRREMVHDIQDVALKSTIEETGYLNLSLNQPKRVRLVNVSVERAIKDYLYLDHISQEKHALSYNLTNLEEEIKQIYERCAWDVSQYRFALRSSYETSELFLSNIEGLDTEQDIPPERAASTVSITLRLQRVEVTLFIWR